MASNSLATLRNQIGSVRRRLLLQSLVNHLIVCWAVVLAATALWFVIQPFLIGNVEPRLRWLTFGCGAAAGLAGAVLLTWLRAPSRIDAALALDGRFELKERVTTALMLTEGQLQSPAGQALLVDCRQQVQKLKIGARFPLRMSWKRILFPATAALLALLALFFEPDLRRAEDSQVHAKSRISENEEAEKKKSANAKKDLNKVARLLEEIKKNKIPELEVDSDRLLEKIATTNPKDKKELREIAGKIRQVEEKLKAKAKDLREQLARKKRLEDQLADLKVDEPKGDRKQEGPAKKMLKALQDGDMKQARKEAKKLLDKLARKDLEPRDRKNLGKQLEQLDKQIKKQQQDRAAKKKQLEKDDAQGKLNEQQKKELEQMKDLEQMRQTLKQCQDCAKNGDVKKFAENLKKLQGQMKKLAGRQKDLQQQLKKLAPAQEQLKELAKNQKLLAKMRQAMLKNLNGKLPNDRQANNPMEQRARKQPGGKGFGRRPEGKAEPVKHFEAKQKSPLDKKGSFKVTGYELGGSFKRIAAKDVAGEVRKSTQQLQRAVESQRISPEDAGFLKGYYKNVGGQRK